MCALYSDHNAFIRFDLILTKPDLDVFGINKRLDSLAGSEFTFQ